MPYYMSIETVEGKSFQHGFHLGTDEVMARALCEEKFKARVENNMPTITIALISSEGKLVDTFYGDRWHNGY